MIEIIGMGKVLDFIKRKTDISILDKAMHHIMIQARNMSKNRFCPVKTGMLRDSIYIRKIAPAVYQMGATMYYGVWHEFGSYNIKAGTVESPNLIKTGYSPFIRPPLWIMLKKFPDIFKEYFEKA